MITSRLKRALAFALLMVCTQLALAQRVFINEVDTLERARIAQERAAVEAEHQSEQRACYQYFAVNNCLDKARENKRKALGILREQEIELNDVRRRHAAERAAQRRQLKLESLEKAAQTTPQKAIAPTQ